MSDGLTLFTDPLPSTRDYRIELAPPLGKRYPERYVIVDRKKGYGSLFVRATAGRERAEELLVPRMEQLQRSYDITHPRLAPGKYEVQGSKGKTYVVEQRAGYGGDLRPTCTCPAFRFSRMSGTACKHIKRLIAEQAE